MEDADTMEELAIPTIVIHARDANVIIDTKSGQITSVSKDGNVLFLDAKKIHEILIEASSKDTLIEWRRKSSNEDA